MTKKLNLQDPTAKRIVDTSETYRPIDSDRVSSALHAEQVGRVLDDALGPITLLALRDEIADRLKSTGGRPSLSGTTKRAKIPVSDFEWSELELIAKELSTEDVSPSAGQVASLLLSVSLQRLLKSIASDGAKSQILNDLAARTAAVD